MSAEVIILYGTDVREDGDGVDVIWAGKPVQTERRQVDADKVLKAMQRQNRRAVSEEMLDTPV